jgi:hypothetical protein
MTIERKFVRGEKIMSNGIDPEAARPTTVQSFEQSNRNPTVVDWGGTDAEGGLIASPASSESRITPIGPPAPVNAGLQNYDTGDQVDSVEDEAEREG